MKSNNKQSDYEGLSDGLKEAIKKKLNELRQKEGISCRIDSDCPPGYVCINGKCEYLFSFYAIP